jgi:cell division protein FtsZ
MNDFNLNLEFDLVKNKSNVIKVIGVGGGGGNAVNYMYKKGIKDVDFVVVNTDTQDLTKSPIPNKIQIGKNLTEGLGAGANPEIGERAVNEDIEAIKAVLENNTKMIFITAGMGGGTGTGAAPVIAKLAKEMGILTVGIVTSPFQYEGKKRNDYAQKGIENLRDYVDSLIIINNNKLREIYGNLTYGEAFAKSDEVLASAATSIAEVITHNYMVNVDFRDVKTVLENSGTAIMGSAQSGGENRSHDVITQALDSPLLNDNRIKGAKNVLLLILSGSSQITIDEISEINDFIQQEAGNNADVIMGIGEDESLGDEVSVTIIATGFAKNQQDVISNADPDRIVHVFKNDADTFVETTVEKPLEPESVEIEPVVKRIDEYGNTQFMMNFEDIEAEKKANSEADDYDMKIIKKEETIDNDIVEETPPLLFDLNQGKEVENNYDDVEDLSELPVEIAFKLRKKRKSYMNSYINKIELEEEDQTPAFKKQGIDIDLSPKSTQQVHKIEMDSEGNFKLRDTNSFLDDNVD